VVKMPVKDEIKILEQEESQMRGEGWTRELTIKKVIARNGVIFCQEWDFFADSMPCEMQEGGTGPKCGVDHTWVKCYHGKLFWACGIHQTCYGPISFEGTGTMAKQYAVTAEEAVKICRDTEQSIPPEVRNLFRMGKTLTRKRRRPT